MTPVFLHDKLVIVIYAFMNYDSHNLKHTLSLGICKEAAYKACYAETVALKMAYPLHHNYSLPLIFHFFHFFPFSFLISYGRATKLSVVIAAVKY